MQDIKKIVNQMHTAIDFGDFEGGGNLIFLQTFQIVDHKYRPYNW